MQLTPSSPSIPKILCVISQTFGIILDNIFSPRDVNLVRQYSLSCALATIMMRIGIEDRIKRDNKCSSSCDNYHEGEDENNYGEDDAHADLMVWHVIIIITM